MNRVSYKCDCYINGRNCPPALANRSWLHDEQAKRDFNNAHNAARAQCTSWTSLRVRNMTEANKADVLPAKKLALIRTVTAEGDKALAAISRVEMQASGVQMAALGREDARRRAAEETRLREEEAKRIAEEKSRRETEEANRSNCRNRFCNPHRGSDNGDSSPSVNPGMKAALDAVNEMQRRLNGGAGYNSPSPSYSPPSRRSRSSRSSSYAGSSGNTDSMTTITRYTRWQKWSGSEEVSTDSVASYQFVAAYSKGCNTYNSTRFTIYRHTVKVPTSKASIYGGGMSAEGLLRDLKRQDGDGRNDTRIFESRQDAQNWLRSMGCKTTNR